MLRIALVLFTLLLPLAAQAQAPSPPAQRLLSAMQTLGLTPLQKQQLMQIALEARARHQALRAEQQALADAAGDDLAAGTADLATLASQQEALTDRRIAAARESRDALLAFYFTLSAGQQAQIQGWLATALDRLDALRALADTFSPNAGL
jgi:hypothetical protein